jgi:hypothetical protein
MGTQLVHGAHSTPDAAAAAEGLLHHQQPPSKSTREPMESVARTKKVEVAERRCGQFTLVHDRVNVLAPSLAQKSRHPSDRRWVKRQATLLARRERTSACCPLLPPRRAQTVAQPLKHLLEHTAGLWDGSNLSVAEHLARDERETSAGGVEHGASTTAAPKGGGVLAGALPGSGSPARCPKPGGVRECTNPRPSHASMFIHFAGNDTCTCTAHTARQSLPPWLRACCTTKRLLARGYANPWTASRAPRKFKVAESRIGDFTMCTIASVG